MASNHYLGMLDDERLKMVVGDEPVRAIVEVQQRDVHGYQDRRAKIIVGRGKRYGPTTYSGHVARYTSPVFSPGSTRTVKLGKSTKANSDPQNEYRS